MYVHLASDRRVWPCTSQHWSSNRLSPSAESTGMEQTRRNATDKPHDDDVCNFKCSFIEKRTGENWLVLFGALQSYADIFGFLLWDLRLKTLRTVDCELIRIPGETASPTAAADPSWLCSPHAADVRCSGCQSFTLTHAESYSVSLTVVNLRITYLHGTELLIEARTMTYGESTCLAHRVLTLHVTAVLTLHIGTMWQIPWRNIERDSKTPTTCLILSSWPYQTGPIKSNPNLGNKRCCR